MIEVGFRISSLLALATLAFGKVEPDPAQIGEANGHSSGAFPTFTNDPEPARPPESFMTYMADGRSPPRRRSDDPVQYLYDVNQIYGFIDHTTGETRFFPNYTDLKPIQGPVDLQAAFSLLKKGDSAFPPDDLSIELVEGSKLLGSDSGGYPKVEGSGSVSKREDGSDSTFLVVGTVNRFTKLDTGHKLPTCGTGSQAIFSVDHNNKVVSLTHRWKKAKKDHKLSRKPLSTDKVVEQIKKKFDTKHYFGCDIKIETIDTCLFDSGAKFLQPVYRLIGKAFDPDNNSTLGSRRFLEYIPIGGDALEPIPHPATEFAGVDAYEPALEPGTTPSKRSLLSYFDARNSKPQITVGRYLVRNDSDGFLEDARNFWSQLSPSTIFKFVRKGFFWAYPRLYKEDANQFVNDVNIALTEGHGLFHGFSTYDGSTSVDFVKIPSDLAPGGYGPASNNGKGQLGYWFIDASEVMPTRTDFKALKDPNSQRSTFDPWWPVFHGGIHAILSWRTSALFADNTAARAARDIALGVPVVTAWLEAALTDPAYQGKPTYTGQSSGLPDWPLGKAAAMFRCGRIGDKPNNLENLGAPNCLSVWWWNND